MSKVYTKEQAFAAEMDIRTCIWWGVLCAWDWFRAKDSQSVKLALDTCVRWYYDPSETHRIAARELATEEQNPAVLMLLRAIFFTGNVAPEKCPEVTLDAKTSKVMVASCLDILLAKVPVVQRDKYVDRFEQLYREVLQSAS